MLQPDSWIIEQARKGMIQPFEESLVSRLGAREVISFGTSSYGYDVRCGTKFKIFVNNGLYGVIDPKEFHDNSFVEVEGDSCIIPPHSFALAHTKEYFKIPRDTFVICVGKSTYARCGLIVNVLQLEPEWEGQVTLELSNTTHLPAKVYANEGVAKMVFFRAEKECDISYKDRNGRFQQSRGITISSIV